MLNEVPNINRAMHPKVMNYHVQLTTFLNVSDHAEYSRKGWLTGDKIQKLERFFRIEIQNEII